MPIPASILVADGSRDCADAVAMMLEENGMRAAVAYDGASALLLGSRERFDAAVMDIAIPGASSFEVAEVLRRRQGSSIRLVAYTAWPESVMRRTDGLAAFDEIVSKASDPLELLRAISLETYGALLRSMQASAEQLRLELSLAHGQLDRAWIARDEETREQLRSLVKKRLLFVERASSRLLMSDTREGIETELELLRARIAQLR